MWTDFLFLMRFRRFGFCASLIALLSACASDKPFDGTDGLGVTSSQQLYDFMVAQSVANKRARDIVQVCLPLQLNRAAIRQRNALLSDEMERLGEEDPQVLREFAERMGIPIDNDSDFASQTSNSRPTALALTQLNSGMLADFGGSVLLQLALAPPSASCADGAREIDGGTLVGSFLMPVGGG
jgi:hypothetical protein